MRTGHGTFFPENRRSRNNRLDERIQRWIVVGLRVLRENVRAFVSVNKMSFFF